MGPQCGIAICAFGLMLAFNSIQVRSSLVLPSVAAHPPAHPFSPSQIFTTEFTAPFSAAGIAGITLARSITSCILPIFSANLFENLGWGPGASVLAGLSLLALPLPSIMFVYGVRLRERFKFVD